MENNRKSQDQTKGEDKQKEAKPWNEGLTAKIRWSFYEFYIFGWCWIGGFGFDKYGNTYERKKVKQ